MRSSNARPVVRRFATEQALRESEARFRALAELTSDWFWEQDEELRFTIVSANGYRTMQMPEGSYLGLKRWELPGVELVSESWEEHKRTLAERRAFRNLIVRERDGAGNFRTLAVNGAPIFDDLKRFCGYRGTGQDITDRVNAERALRESETRFRKLTELSSDWYWEQDEEFRFSFVSDAAFRILGGSAEHAIGKYRWELPTEEIEGGWEAHKAILAARMPFRDVIVRRLDSNRKRHVFSITGSPVFDEDGRFRGYRGITREITAQVMADEALRESERRVRFATERTAIGIWERDFSTDCVRWSANIGAMLGRPGQNGTTPNEYASFIHPDDRDAYVRNRAAWTETGTMLDAEHRIVWPDGTTRWVQLRGALERTPEGRPLRSLGVIQDITQRKDAESVLRESEEKFRLLAEQMRDVFWIYNPTLERFEYLAPSYESVWGQPREAIYADANAYRKLVVSEDLPTVKAVRARQWRGEPTEVEFRIRRPDGELRWLVARSGPMTNGRGDTLVCGITEDITERKQREERRVEDALRQRDALVREVHHRVKNTLQGLIGMLRRQMGPSRGNAPAIENAIAQLQSVAVVHGLQGKRTPGIALPEMLEAMANMHEGLSGRRVRVALGKCCGVPTQLAEEQATAIALILNELVSNAVKHCAQEPPPTIVLGLEYDAKRVSVRVRNPGRLPQGFNDSREQRLGTGLRLVQTLTPREGVRIAFAQDGEEVEVTVEIRAPLLVSVG